MILNIIMFKNEKIQCFGQPQFDDHDPEKAAEQLRRSLIVEKEWKNVAPFRNLKMYVVGTFDDQTGEIFKTEPRLLLDCSEIVKGREDYVESGEIHRN